MFTRIKAAIRLPEKPEASTAQLKSIAAARPGLFFAELETTFSGLSLFQVEEKRRQFGFNEVGRESAQRWGKQFLSAFLNPFIGILAVIAAVAAITDIWLAPKGEEDYKTLLVVGFMVLLSGCLRFVQEFRSNQAARRLKNLVRTTVSLQRRDQLRAEADIRELVPGDIVYLGAGDMIPADCRLIQAKDLFVSQAMLTGESLPVEKSARTLPEAEELPVLELSNTCFMGTNVISGSAIAMVVHTGSQTQLGLLNNSLVDQKPETSFDKGVGQVSYLLIRFMLVMVPLIFQVNGLMHQDWTEAFLFAVAVAVGLTPEMLPMIVTANLARGALRMSRHQVIVKQLQAIQNIGAMDVFCTDKTGTLTQDDVALEKYLNLAEREDDTVLKWAYLNSLHQTGLRNLLDSAILRHASRQEMQEIGTFFEKVDEIPFDFQRRRMSVVLRQIDGSHVLICKGAVEEMLSVSGHAVLPAPDGPGLAKLDAANRELIRRQACSLHEEGLRVLLVAIKEPDFPHSDYSVDDEEGLTIVGMVGFLDPPKPSARASIESMQALGVQVKVLTGDNEIVSRKICSDVGIPVDRVLSGPGIDKLSDEELGRQLVEVALLARLTPLQKSRVVRILKQNGHTVGFMGDGINDAPALRDADVGISVDTAVDIAKESADIILLNKDLNVLQQGIIDGRRTFGNILKYIKMAASSNFGNMFSLLGASVLLPFLPMLPVQLLVQNLLYDLSQTSIPWDNMDDDFLRRPQKWNASGIRRFMLIIGPVSSLFDYATFALLYWVFRANGPEGESLFQSGWFVEGLLSQTLIVHLIRTRKVPFVQSRAATPVLVMTLLVMGTGMVLPFSPLARALHLQPLPLTFFPWLAGLLLSYCFLTQVVKQWYIRKFDQWL